jgi:hypothetical protein
MQKAAMWVTDSVASLLVPCLTQALQRHAPNLGLEIIPYYRTYDELETGKMDLLFSPVEAPTPLRTQYLYADTFTCVISEESSFQGGTSFLTSI